MSLDEARKEAAESAEQAAVGELEKAEKVEKTDKADKAKKEKKKRTGADWNAQADHYDRMMSRDSTPFRNFISKLMVGEPIGDAMTEASGRLLEEIPDDFEGLLLDVPAGTGSFTAEKYARLKNADIVLMDFSDRMLEIFRDKMEKRGADHPRYLKGDVGSIPLPDECCDFVFTMNGLQCFPDKPKAISEMLRTLKKGGMFLGLFHLKGLSKRVDMGMGLLSKFYEYWPGPQLNRDEIVALLEKECEVTRFEAHHTFAACVCVKKS